MDSVFSQPAVEAVIRIRTLGGVLEGYLSVPRNARGVIIVAHASGNERHSPKNQRITTAFDQRRLGTLVIDLFTAEEDRVDRMTSEHRTDISLLADRLLVAADWLAKNHSTKTLRAGLFGTGTVAAASLVAAAHRPEIDAVVSRGGRPDLAGQFLPDVTAATLLIVGSLERTLIGLNRDAAKRLIRARRVEVKIVDGAAHLFEEPGTVEEAAGLAGQWFERYLGMPTNALRSFSQRESGSVA